MPFEIKPSLSGWKAVHSQGRCGGPRAIFLQEQPILTDVCCSVDGIGDDALHCRTAHVYHKAGTAVFESKGTYANGATIAQASRYFGNAVRTTYDVHWPKAAVPKKPVEAGSFLLPGRWVRMLVLKREALAGGDYAWQEITPGETFQWEEHPLSLVFLREDGTKVEASLGFDIWRWDEGLGIRRKTAASVEVTEECVSVHRFISGVGSEENLPLNRDYRFISVLAWSTPEMEKCALPANTRELEYDEKGNGIIVPKMPLAAEEAFLLNLEKLSLIESAGRLGADGTRNAICVEAGHSISHLKRFIRQISGIGPEGRLVIKGMQPGLCLDGTHCAKKAEKAHWDLHSILTFTAWAANCLGDGWKIDFLPGEGWTKELPSLMALHLCCKCE